MLVDLCAGCNLTFRYKVKTGISKLGKKSNYSVNMLSSGFLDNEKKNSSDL